MHKRKIIVLYLRLYIFTHLYYVLSDGLMEWRAVKVFYKCRSFAAENHCDLNKWNLSKIFRKIPVLYKYYLFTLSWLSVICFTTTIQYQKLLKKCIIFVQLLKIFNSKVLLKFLLINWSLACFFEIKPLVNKMPNF